MLSEEIIDMTDESQPLLIKSDLVPSRKTIRFRQIIFIGDILIALLLLVESAKIILPLGWDVFGLILMVVIPVLGAYSVSRPKDTREALPWLALLANLIFGLFMSIAFIAEFYHGWQTMISFLAAFVAISSVFLIANRASHKIWRLLIAALVILSVAFIAISTTFGFTGQCGDRHRLPVVKQFFCQTNLYMQLVNYFGHPGCWKSEAALHIELQKYNHCATAFDCTIVHGTRCGYQSGLVTNKGEVGDVMPLINSCPSAGCQEDTLGIVYDVACVNNSCRFQPRSSP
jgi:hypothetical protein